ncbi:MAG TPA: tetraacyldisaccharide 4'-kinase, partial [Pyrinomonadaceae bacterium]|nr:tetraacyldisaccharide 4'-kinase [Pyrinomonadaceae bacterium]
MHYPLAPLSLLYAALMRVRNASYDRGVFAAHRAGRPVISVGNVTTGGTGKTPLVEWVARAMARRGFFPCVLTRGYGRTTSGRVVVSDGANILADAARGGDEPQLLAQNLRGIAAVVADADRVAAARWATENLRAQVFVLDDGFQHRRLHRDLDIVVIDATDPWSNCRVLPAGRLREPLTALKRADALILTRTEQSARVTEISAQLSSLTDRPIIHARTRALGLRPLSSSFQDAREDASTSPGAYVAFCALGNPRAFYQSLIDGGCALAARKTYPDHHRYTQSDVDELSALAHRSGATALITTQKDAVKL